LQPNIASILKFLITVTDDIDCHIVDGDEKMTTISIPFINDEEDDVDGDENDNDKADAGDKKNTDKVGDDIHIIDNDKVGDDIHIIDNDKVGGDIHIIDNDKVGDDIHINDNEDKMMVDKRECCTCSRSPYL
jgi:hypothetical protein